MASNILKIVVEAESEIDARVKIMRKLREMGGKKRCSDYDDDCSTMSHGQALHCYLGLGGSCPISDGYCPIIHAGN